VLALSATPYAQLHELVAGWNVAGLFQRGEGEEGEADVAAGFDVDEPPEVE